MIADQAQPEDTVPHHQTCIQGLAVTPDLAMPENTVDNAERVREPIPMQAIPSRLDKIARASPIIDLRDDEKVWETVIVCYLFGKSFKRALTSDDIAQAINIRDHRTNAALKPDTVENMFEIAKLPSDIRPFPKTCRYEKWKAAKDRLAARKGLGFGADADVKKAFEIFSGITVIVDQAVVGRHMRSAS